MAQKWLASLPQVDCDEDFPGHVGNFTHTKGFFDEVKRRVNYYFAEVCRFHSRGSHGGLALCKAINGRSSGCFFRVDCTIDRLVNRVEAARS